LPATLPTADSRQIAHAGNPRCNGEENNGRDDHFDQLNEAITKRL
jgi:hypothetical protein